MAVMDGDGWGEDAFDKRMPQLTSNDFELSMEAQFKLRVVSEQAQRLSREQAIDMVVELSRQLLFKDTILKNLISKGCG